MKGKTDLMTEYKREAVYELSGEITWLIYLIEILWEYWNISKENLLSENELSFIRS